MLATFGLYIIERRQRIRAKRDKAALAAALKRAHKPDSAVVDDYCPPAELHDESLRAEMSET